MDTTISNDELRLLEELTDGTQFVNIKDYLDNDKEFKKIATAQQSVPMVKRLFDDCQKILIADLNNLIE